MLVQRNPKMELSRSDLLRLLSILEGELQAREIVIAVLKAEQIKKLLYPSKLASLESLRSKTIRANDKLNPKPSDANLVEYCDPWNALSRDAFGAYDPSFDKSATVALFNMKMNQLEALIAQQRRARTVLLDQLQAIEAKYKHMAAELEAERRTRSEANGGARSPSLATVRIETEAKAIAQTLENERNREKQIVLCLLSERKQLIIKLIEERQKNEELLHLLSTEKGRIAEMVEGLEDESKRSLQMEAELEKYLNDFEGERQKFRTQLSASETRNAELAAEVDRLRQQLSDKQSAGLSLGEGVRSAIVTMSSGSRCVPAVPCVSSVSQPRASVAQHVSSAQSQPSVKAKSPVSAQHSYATVQPISSSKLNATIPPPPSTPAPPPKALVNNLNSAKAGAAKTNAFQNMTYSLETNRSGASEQCSPGQAPTAESQPSQANHRAEAPNRAPPQTSQSPAANPTVQRKLSAGGVGRGAPPPIPPNKPVIKPVLPPQALQQRSKDLNSAKVVSGAKSGLKDNANASVASNSIKKAAINSSDSTGERSGRPLPDTTHTTDSSSVDILCQELENFNSLLVSMVSTASQNNS